MVTKAKKKPVKKKKQAAPKAKATPKKAKKTAAARASPRPRALAARARFAAATPAALDVAPPSMAPPPVSVPNPVAGIPPPAPTPMPLPIPMAVGTFNPAMLSGFTLAQPAPAPVDPGPPPAGVQLVNNFAWTNYGTNLTTPTGTYYRLSNGPANSAVVGLQAMQWAVRHLAFNGGGGSPVGSSWSFSDVAMNANAMIDIRSMGKQLTFSAADLANPADAARLLQVQGGTMVQQLITYAENAGRDLIAMGGNCGQTVAGAVSTGTHGGFIGRPGFPDMVRALHLIGEDGKRHWIERPSRPVLSAATKAAYQNAGIGVHDQDEMFFNHAVVSLGAFGLVYSITIDTLPMYWVHVHRESAAFDDTLDKLAFDRDFGGNVPLDFSVVVNPYAMTLQNGKWRGGPGSAVPTRIDAAPQNTAIDPPGSNLQINDLDLGKLLAEAAAAIPPAVPPLVGFLMNQMYGLRDAKGPMSVSYPLALAHAPTVGMEIGVPGPLARGVFGRILAYVQGAPQKLPGIIAIRQTARSQATLSMAQWDPTTTFEFGCLKVPGTEELLGGLLDQLEQQGVPFTLHLGMLHGKDANGQSWLTAQRLRNMFGPGNVAAWVAARQTTCPSGKVFSNARSRALGLTT